MSEQRAGGERKGDGGYLFPNNKTNPKQPDWRGKATINGKEMLVSGWNRDTPDGQMISFSFTDPASLPPRGQGQGGQGNQQGGQSAAPQRQAPAAQPVVAPTSQQPAPNYEQSLLDDLDDLFKPDGGH